MMMIKRTLLLATISALTLSLYGQANLDSIPMYSYKFSQEISSELSAGKMRTHSAAQYYSYIGEYASALQINNDPEHEWGFDTMTIDDQQYFEGFEPRDAVKAIIDQSKNEQIIIINEAHHRPVHRVFTKKLLSGLAANGYKYLGLEALANCAHLPPQYCDTDINERGYPLNSPLSGSYTTEPQMAQLIRTAHDLGFELFGYDQFGKDREINQAKHINRILQKDPGAKILIHCGWHHLLEEPLNKTWMAAHLKEMTGIDPFTIYQDILIERYATAESPIYSLMNFDSEKVFVNQQGEFYNGKRGLKSFDALVYHPRTHYRYNRPHWLYEQDDMHFYPISKEYNLSFPWLIMAYAIDEIPQRVPVDIIEISHKNDTTRLLLSKGKYRLKIVNINGEEVSDEIEIKD